jgi:hypothetical protein
VYCARLEYKLRFVYWLLDEKTHDEIIQSLLSTRGEFNHCALVREQKWETTKGPAFSLIDSTTGVTVLFGRKFCLPQCHVKRFLENSHTMLCSRECGVR